MADKIDKVTKKDMQAELDVLSQLVYDSYEQLPIDWARHVFPHFFTEPSPDFHYDIMEYVKLGTDPTVGLGNKLVIAAPRGCAKSTLISFIYMCHCIIYKKKRHIIIVSNTEAKATGHLSTIKGELKDNRRLRDFAPGLKLKKDSVAESIFEHKDGFKTRVLCIGEQQIPTVRGQIFGAHRPDLIIGDDIEDDEMVMNAERRKKLKLNYDTALEPAGARKEGVEACQIVIVGTVLHDDSQLAKLLYSDHYNEYRRIFFKAHINNESESLWEEMWTNEWLNELKVSKPLKYAREYQNNPVAGSNVVFKREDFRYYRLHNDLYEIMSDQRVIKRGSLEDCKPIIAGDLAWEEKKEADYSVIMPCYLTPDSEILVGKYFRKHGLRPDVFCDIVFEMAQFMEKVCKLKPNLALEKAMIEKATKWFFKKEMQKRNYYISMVPTTWERDKITRIQSSLQPRYSNNTIYHQKDMGDLEHELVRFPYGVTDDIIDALHGAVKQLRSPRSKKKIIEQDDAFMEMRKRTPQYKWSQSHEKVVLNNKREIFIKKKVPFIYGTKQKRYELPARKGL